MSNKDANCDNIRKSNTIGIDRLTIVKRRAIDWNFVHVNPIAQSVSLSPKAVIS